MVALGQPPLLAALSNLVGWESDQPPAGSPGGYANHVRPDWLAAWPAGAGAKAGAGPVTDRGGEVVGLDIQPGMLERLKTRAAQAGVSNLTAILGDAAQPHFPAESFEVVYLCTVLGEIPDREAALRQAYAALKPDGLLSITEIFPDPHYQSQATVQRLAETAGFRLAEMHGPWYFFTANFVKT